MRILSHSYVSRNPSSHPVVGIIKHTKEEQYLLNQSVQCLFERISFSAVIHVRMLVGSIYETLAVNKTDCQFNFHASFAVSVSIGIVLQAVLLKHPEITAAISLLFYLHIAKQITVARCGWNHLIPFLPCGSLSLHKTQQVHPMAWTVISRLIPIARICSFIASLQH